MVRIDEAAAIVPSSHTGGLAADRVTPSDLVDLASLRIIGAYPDGVTPRTPARSTSRWTYPRLGLAMLWVLLLASSLLMGERITSMNDFDSAVTSGRVHTVHLVGDLPAGATGSSLVELHWHDRLVARVSEVRQVRPGVGASTGSSGTDRVVVGDLVRHLSSTHPGLRVIRESDSAHQSVGNGTVMGWRVPGWIAVVVVLTWITTLGILVNAPEPWRATRWAWFWIITNPLTPIGSLAFLLLSGPTPLLPEAKPDGRRLRGGWAFIITTVVAGTHAT